MKTERILEILHVVAYIILIGLCIETGAKLISFFVSLFVNPAAARNLYMGMNLSEISDFGQKHYILFVSLLISLSALKAWLFFPVIRAMSKINLSNPFSEYIARQISKMGSIALQIGIIAFITNTYAKWLIKNDLHFDFNESGTDFLFLAGILFVIATIFKRGIELQSENELTI